MVSSPDPPPVFPRAAPERSVRSRSIQAFPTPTEEERRSERTGDHVLHFYNWSGAGQRPLKKGLPRSTYLHDDL